MGIETFLVLKSYRVLIQDDCLLFIVLPYAGIIRIKL